MPTKPRPSVGVMGPTTPNSRITLTHCQGFLIRLFPKQSTRHCPAQVRQSELLSAGIRPAFVARGGTEEERGHELTSGDAASRPPRRVHNRRDAGRHLN